MPSESMEEQVQACWNISLGRTVDVECWMTLIPFKEHCACMVYTVVTRLSSLSLSTVLAHMPCSLCMNVFLQCIVEFVTHALCVSFMLTSSWRQDGYLCYYTSSIPHVDWAWWSHSPPWGQVTMHVMLDMHACWSCHAR